MASTLQVIAVSFGLDSDFQNRVLAEVDRLAGRGVLRLLDLLFVAKNENGAIERLAVDDEDFGALLATIAPLDGADAARPADGDDPAGFDLAEAWALAESLLPGTALALLLIEHSWAEPLFGAIAETGGAVLAEGFLTSEAGLVLGNEVAAMEEATAVIALAQAAEADAELSAVAAESRAFDALATSEAIRAAAAADAVRALITAGLVEEAAAHEALEALSAAGLIVASANEAAAEAVAKAAATARAASLTIAETRVLRYLPTKSTLAVIAAKLGISRSAAKDRAERAYKKLGVHSRAEAVSRARALGIIG